MGYQRPSATTAISDSYEGHRNRPKPSTEPGTDYPCAYGSAIFAPDDGVVVDVKTSNTGATGRYVAIRLDSGKVRRTRSLHLSRVLVAVGQRVKRGQEVARSGASANGHDWGVGAHVHQTLWDFDGYRFGRDATIDFERFVGDAVTAASQIVKDRQNWLNQARGEKLVVDGVFVDTLPDGSEGKTKAAIKRYQTFLRAYGYTGPIDGIWGGGTQTAHQKYWDECHAKPTTPGLHTATVADLADLQWVNGLQKIAHLYGYGKGQPQSVWMDNNWGGGSRTGLQAFLNQNYGGSLAAWLRAKWGYADRDDLWGPNMNAAAARAEAENYKVL